jgi:GT2 family glycosyltransferase
MHSGGGRTLSVGITTRNRPDALRACLASMTVISSLDPEVLVFDDGSAPPASEVIGKPASAVRFIRDASTPGYIVGRNRLVAEAEGEFVLLLDDDTRLLSAESIASAIAVMRADPRVAAVAFAQAEADGRPWPERMQPSPARVPTVVRSFIGFAHLLRRAVFLELGGYRESFEFYGEEKEFCLRLIDAGYQTVYLPAALVAHVIDSATRDRRRYLRCVARNDCLNTLYNDPFTRLLWMLPARFALYFRMRRSWQIADPWGGAWLARDIAARLPRVWRDRRPVSRATLARWRALRTRQTAYEMPRMPAGSLPGH